MATVGQRNKSKQIAQQRAAQPDATLGSVLLVRQRDEALAALARSRSLTRVLNDDVNAHEQRIRHQQLEIAALRIRPTWGGVFAYTSVIGVLAIGSYFV